MAQAYRVIISNAALSELEAIFDYVHERSPQGARVVIEQVLSSIDGLDSMPSRYKVVGKSRKTGAAIRAFSVYSLIIYYKADEETQTVSVLTVRHGKRRQPRRFE